jgi:hypothetical protein
LAIECAAAAIQLAAPGVGGADESDRLVALDGSITSGQVTGMKADAGAGGRVQLSGSAKAVDLYSLYRMERTNSDASPFRERTSRLPRGVFQLRHGRNFGGWNTVTPPSAGERRAASLAASSKTMRCTTRVGMPACNAST